MSDLLMDGSLILAAVGIGLTAALIVVYRRVYLQTPSQFGIALLIFAGAFAAQNALTVYSYLATMPLIPGPMVPSLFGIGLCETTGLSAMLWTASR